MWFLVFLIIDVLIGWGIYGDSYIKLITFQGGSLHGTTSQVVVYTILSLVAFFTIMKIHEDMSDGGKPTKKDPPSSPDKTD